MWIVSYSTDIEFLFTSLGVIALAGIVVNNNIVWLIHIMLLQEKILSIREEIVVRTAAQRLRPIILTTATTVIGLLPLASGIGVDFSEKYRNRWKSF